MAEIIEVQGDLEVIIDLAQLQFVDSRGVRILLDAHKTLQERGGTLTLSGPRPGVHRVLELTGLATRFTVTQT